jgi:Skp family chaperone for outer membrane proteins
MCSFSIALVDFNKLSAKQKKALLEKYEQKRKAVQAQLKETNATLKGLTKAVKHIKSKSKPKRR